MRKKKKPDMITREIFGQIPYTLIRQWGRRTLSVAVDNDNSVVVKASRTLPGREITGFLRSKEPWLRKMFVFNTRVRTPYRKKRFLDGETFLYLGKEFPLRVIRGCGPRIILHDDTFYIGVPGAVRNARGYIRNEFIRWYKQAAEEVFMARTRAYEGIYGVSSRDIRICTLNRTWASCSSKGRITFSWRLIMAPLRIVDYIVAHELCHLLYHDHSARFWGALGNGFPSYEACKRWLTINEELLRL